MIIRHGGVQTSMGLGQERFSVPRGAVRARRAKPDSDCCNSLEMEPVIRFFRDCLSGKSIPQLRSAYTNQLYAGTDRPTGFYTAAFQKLADLCLQPLPLAQQNLLDTFRLCCILLERLQNGMRMRSGLSQLWLNNAIQDSREETLRQDYRKVQQALGQIFQQISDPAQVANAQPNWIDRWLSRRSLPESVHQSRLRAWGILTDALVQGLASPMD